MEIWMQAFLIGVFAGVSSTLVKNKIGQIIILGLFFAGTWIYLKAGNAIH